jgi:hypothetical protein
MSIDDANNTLVCEPSTHYGVDYVLELSPGRDFLCDLHILPLPLTQICVACHAFRFGGVMTQPRGKGPLAPNEEDAALLRRAMDKAFRLALLRAIRAGKERLSSANAALNIGPSGGGPRFYPASLPQRSLYGSSASFTADHADTEIGKCW